MILMVFSGCTAIGGSDSVKHYETLKEISYARAAGLDEDASRVELTDTPTLSEYLAYAAINNPELKAAFNQWKAALEKIPQVRSLPDPRFTYAYYIENVETRVGPQRHKLDLSQTFPWFGKLDLLGDVALEEAHIKKQAYETLKFKLFYTVKAAYYEYYYLSRSLSITEENLKLLSYFENVARIKYESGKAAYADVIKAQVELGKLEERLLSLREMQQPVTARLNAVLNRPTDATLPQPTAIPELDINLGDTEIARQIQETNPELKELDLQIEKVTKSGDLAKKQFYPDVTVGLSYIETGPSSMPGIVESGKDPVMAMLSINLPLWRTKYHAAVIETDMLRRSALRKRENRENMLRAELTTALYNFRDAGRKIELFRDMLIPKALQVLNVTQTAFESGTKDFLSLIDTQRTLLEFELAYEHALTNRATSRARVEMLIGKDFEE